MGPSSRPNADVLVPIRIILVALVVVAAIFDLVRRRIPNWLTAAGVVAGIGTNVYLLHWTGLRTSLLGIGVALLVYVPFYLLRAMGGGDVKLMMAVGSLAGPLNWLTIFVITSILGGLIAILMVLFKGRLQSTLWNVWFIVQQLGRFKAPYREKPELDVRTDQGLSLPHGAVIALGTAAFLAMSR